MHLMLHLHYAAVMELQSEKNKLFQVSLPTFFFPLVACKVQFVDEYDKIEMVRTVGADGLAEEEYNFNSEVSLGSQVCTTTVLFYSSQTGRMWLGNTTGYRTVVGGIHYHGHLIVKHSWHSF